MTGEPGGERRENPVVHEVRLALTALMFYTRLPVPKWVGYSDEQLNRSTRWFPAAGWLVGGAVAGAIAATRLVLPLPAAVTLGVAAGVLLTGAFHEDGFADVCDGFGGGTTRERTLEIMKDSRVGAFAVIGLICLFAVKLTAYWGLVAAHPWAGLAGIVFAHVASRWCVVTVIFAGTYARADLTSKVKPIGRSLSPGGLAASTVWLAPFAALACWHPWWLAALPAAFLARLLLARWFNRRLGGYTGDCLGAAQQVLEVVVVLVILALTGLGV